MCTHACVRVCACVYVRVCVSACGVCVWQCVIVQYCVGSRIWDCAVESVGHVQ